MRFQPTHPPLSQTHDPSPQVLLGRAPLTIPWLTLRPRPNATLVSYAENRLSLLYRRDTLPSRTSLNGANFAIIAALSLGLLLLHMAWKAEARLGLQQWRPLLLEWMAVVGLSSLESFLAETFTAPLVQRQPIYDVASLYSCVPESPSHYRANGSRMQGKLKQAPFAASSPTPLPCSFQQ